MYVGIDVGGTKTLVAALDDLGKIVEQDRFPTPTKYEDFLSQLEEHLSHFEHHEFQAGGAGFAGIIDREQGRLVNWTTQPWHDCPVQSDLEKIAKCPMVIENDAKMGALSEAMLLKDKYHKILYVAIGTGIGVALVVGGQIDASIGDGGGRALMLGYEGKMTSWEDFAGGRALVERFGKKAQDITDAETWSTYCRGLAKGLLQFIAMTEPDTIVIGGSVGTYFDRYGELLSAELEKFKLPLVNMPKAILGASRPEEAVIYGCYDLAKQIYPHA